MFEWLQRLVRKEAPKDEQRPPPIAAGQLWALRPDDSPFEPKAYKPVTIIAVQDGWVRYDMGGFAFRDQRHPVKTFVQMYKRVDA